MNAKILSLGLTAILATPIIVASAVQAQSNPSCTHQDCEGLDPIATRCSLDQKVVRDHLQGVDITENGSTANGTQVAGRVFLLFSPTCGTNWTQVESFLNNETITVGIRRLGQERSKKVPDQTFTNPPNHTINSKMLYAPLDTDLVITEGQINAQGRRFWGCLSQAEPNVAAQCPPLK